jgi:hypothetical protein
MGKETGDLRCFSCGLAKKIGVKEAIVFNQIHYWMGKKPHKRDGKYWVYNSFPAWQKQLDFYHVRSIENAIYKLLDLEIITSGNYNKIRGTHTRWYSINYNHPILVECGIKASHKFCENPSQKIGEPLTKNRRSDLPKNRRSIHSNTRKITSTDYYKLRGGPSEIKPFLNSQVLDAFNRLHLLQQAEITNFIANQVIEMDELPKNGQAYVTALVDRGLKDELSGFDMSSLEHCKERCGEV